MNTSIPQSEPDQQVTEAVKAGDLKTAAGLLKAAGVKNATPEYAAQLVQLGEPPQQPQPQQAPAWRPYPVDALPQPLRRFAIEAAKAINVDPSMIALPSLAMLATCIGDSRAIQVTPDWVQIVSLWPAVVAPSGSGKTPSEAIALAPLRDLQRDAFREHEQALRLYERDKQEYDASQRRGDAGDTQEPEQPICPRLVITDTTTEALPGVLKAAQTGAVLMDRGELAGWIADLDRYASTKGGDGARWLNIWDAKPITIDRKGDGTTYIHRPIVNIFGGIQPGILPKSFDTDHREAGMLWRFLLAMPPVQPQYETDQQISQAAKDAMKATVSHLLTLRPKVRPPLGEREPVLVAMSSEARQVWRPWRNALADEIQAADGDEASMLAKYPSHAARLALVLHLTRWAGGEPVHDDQIDPDSIRAATTLADWHINEARRVLALLAGDAKTTGRDRLAAWIIGKGGAVSAAELARSGPRAYRGDVEKARAALNDLEAAGLARWDYSTGSQGGRPSARLVMNAANTGYVGAETKPPLATPSGGVSYPATGDYVEV